jgi:hypothetical protein
MISLQRTITSIFIVPLLGLAREQLHDEQLGYRNGYLMDMGRDVPCDNAVYLVFTPKNMTLFNVFLQGERERTTDCPLIDEYDYEGGVVVLVYQMPPQADQIMSLLLNGKYSEFPDAVKESYPKIVKIKDPRTGLQRDEIALQWRIFKKDANLRQYWEGIIGEALDESAEVWSVPDLNRETFDPEKFISETQTSK